MAWRIGFLVALVVTQVLSKPQFAPVAFVEDVVVSDAQSRIVSGWEAKQGQFPHQVSLRMVTTAGAMSACGGSVVHERWIVTAAHCTADRVNAIITAGTVNLLTTPEYLSESNVWFNHPLFDENSAGVVQPNDIALIELQEPITFSDNVKPIRIQPSYDANRNYGEDVLVASGFGRTWTGGDVSQVLNWVYLKGITNAMCYATYGSIITASSICAEHYNVTSQSICQGDSGGPLVYTGDDNVPTLVGVSSFVAGGEYGCHSGLPAGFTRPGSYHSWIREVSGIDLDTYLPTTPNPDENTTENPEGDSSTPKPDEGTTGNPDGDSTTPYPDGDNEDGDSTTDNPEGGFTTPNPDEESTTANPDEESEETTGNPNGPSRPPSTNRPRPPTDNDNKPSRPPTDSDRPRPPTDGNKPRPPTGDNEGKPKPPSSDKPRPPTGSGRPPRPPTDEDDDNDWEGGVGKPKPRPPTDSDRPPRPPRPFPEDSGEESDSSEFDEDSSEERRALKRLLRKLNVKVNVNVEINDNDFKIKHKRHHRTE